MPDRLAPQSDASQGGALPPKGVALRFISGKYQGGEYPLEEGREVLIGRSSDLDMVLVEEMVSRRHARIELRNGIISIEDLGSTNGTFVNGEKIVRGELREGDRVLIGTSILKVVLGVEPSSAGARKMEVQPGRRGNMRQRSAAADEAPRMTGSLEEIPLPDLLQLFAASRKSGVLVIRGEERVGRIYLKDGQIQHAAFDGQPELGALKCMYRMLGSKGGVFELEPPHEEPIENPLGVSVQEVLMEGFRQLDELNALRERLPAMTVRLTLRTPLEAPLHELEPAHLDVLQLAINSPSLEALLDRSPVSDLETAQIVGSLLTRRYLEAK
jgi:pSer/pThr/pTyr-binding forkhead associated (FHA) protein